MKNLDLLEKKKLKFQVFNLKKIIIEYEKKN